MDKVNFTGLRNIGALRIRVPKDGTELINTHMIVNLTDDAAGKDLTEFREVLQKCKPALNNMEFAQDNNFVHILSASYADGSCTPDLAVNHKIIRPETKTMPLFSYIAKLTKRICAMKDKDFVVTPEFKYGEGGENYLIPGTKLSSIVGVPNVKELVYSASSAKMYSEEINDNIYKQMMDYLR